MFNKISHRLNYLKKKSIIVFKQNRKPLRLSRILLKNPMKKVIVKKIRIATPRKPNSARRKIIKGKTTLFQTFLTYIPGGEHSLKNFSQIIVSGRGPRDLPGIYTHAIRGKKDLDPLYHKTKRRSLYGTKKTYVKYQK